MRIKNEGLTIVLSKPKIFYIGESNSDKRKHCFKLEQWVRRYYNVDDFFIDFSLKTYPLGQGYYTPEGQYFKDNRRITTSYLPDYNSLPKEIREQYEKEIKLNKELDDYYILRIYHNEPQYEHHSYNNGYITTTLVSFQQSKETFGKIVLDLKQNKEIEVKDEDEITDTEINQAINEVFNR